MSIFSNIVLTGASARLLSSLEAAVFNPGPLGWTLENFLTESLCKILCLFVIFHIEGSELSLHSQID